MNDTSTKPYLLRALYEWCTDNGYTPYIVVTVDARTRVPMEFVKNGEIVLNISFEATGNLKMDNDLISFKARFGGIARELEIPVDNVSAIYARENGQGMAFEVRRDDQSPSSERAASLQLRKKGAKPEAADDSGASAPVSAASDQGARSDEDNEPPPKPGGRPRLTRIK